MPPRPHRTQAHTAWPLLALLSMCSAHAADSEEDSWQLTLQSVQHCDALPLSRLNDKDALAHARPRSGRNLTYVDDQARASVHREGWDWSFVVRNSGTLVASQDALELGAMLARGESPNTSRTWNTRVRFRQFVGTGLEVGRTTQLSPDWLVTWHIQGLSLKHWRQRRLDGPASYDAATQIYQGQLHSYQADDRLHFPFEEPSASLGWGVLWGGQLQWQSESWIASVAVRDLGWLNWNQLPQQDLQLDSNTLTTDSEGYLIYQPLVQGKDKQNRFSQWQTGWWQVRAGYAMTNQQQLLIGGDRAPDYGWLPVVAWRAGEKNSGAWQAEWRIHERRFSLGWEWAGWTVQAGADRLDSRAQSRNWTVGYARRW